MKPHLKHPAESLCNSQNLQQGPDQPATLPLSLALSLSVSVCLCLSPSVSLSIPLSLSTSLSVSASLSFSLCLPLCLCPLKPQEVQTAFITRLMMQKNFEAKI